MSNVYQQLADNKLRSNIIIVLFILFISLIAYLIVQSFRLDNSVLVLAIMFSLLTSLGSYYYGDQIILSLHQAKPADRKQYFDFYTVTENLSMADQTPMPKIFVIDDPAPNAFATGRDPQHAIVCATTGLLDKLNRSQLEAVIAHELSHIKNYDIRLMMMVSLLIGSLSILIDISYRSTFFRSSDDNRDRSGGILAIVGIILIIFAPIIAQLIRLAISRRREYLADASSAKLTRQPQSLIDALLIISQDKNKLATASTATESIYIANPFSKSKLASLFSTHPPIEDRIKALQTML